MISLTVKEQGQLPLVYTIIVRTRRFNDRKRQIRYIYIYIFDGCNYLMK